MVEFFHNHSIPESMAEDIVGKRKEVYAWVLADAKAHDELKEYHHFLS